VQEAQEQQNKGQEQTTEQGQEQTAGAGKAKTIRQVLLVLTLPAPIVLPPAFCFFLPCPCSVVCSCPDSLVLR